MLENHIHLNAQSDNISQDIAQLNHLQQKQILAYLTERNAKIILDQRKYYKKSYKGENRKIQLWPESVHPQMILDEAIMCQKVDYIHQDLVKKGFVDDALVLALGTKINF